MDRHDLIPDSLIPDSRDLIPASLDLGELSFGTPQASGPLSVVPLLGADAPGAFADPLTGLKISRIEGYGNMELENPLGSSGDGVTIVPLHIGYIQDGAQNHALCRSAFIAAGQKLMFRDACCVQQSQGGYLQGINQWFFVLPLALREEALKLRGQQDYSKLWPAITALCDELGMPSRGHLDQIICRERFYLTQYVSRFERLSGQRGALFFLGRQLVGLEVAPTARFFEEIWMPLVCFCYGAAAMQIERPANKRQDRSDRAASPLDAHDLAGLKRALQSRRTARAAALRESLTGLPQERFSVEEEERFLSLSLLTVRGRDFVGQIVRSGDKTIYASIFARARFLRAAVG